MRTFSREDGFTITELMVSSVILMICLATALTTFKNGLDINDTANQVGDASQNLRAGTNQLVRDLMMAGRIIAADGIPVPNGGGALPVNRPGPPGTTLTFSLVADDDGNIELPAVTPGYQLGPSINGSSTDMVTIMTVDEFMPVLQGIGSGSPTGLQGLIATDGSTLTLPTASPFLVGDATNDSPPIAVGDLLLFKNTNGMAIQDVTAINTTTGQVSFGSGSADWYNFNQRNTAYKGTIYCIKVANACTSSGTFPNTAVMRVLMITYYVDNTTTAGTPRLTRVINHQTPLALAGVVEDLDLTYDLVDASSDSVAGVSSLPFTQNGTTYTAQMIKKVNIHIGVRSESLSKPVADYVRNHINTSVDVRSLASVDRYSQTQ